MARRAKGGCERQKVERRIADDPRRFDGSDLVRRDRIGGARRIQASRYPGQQRGDRPGFYPHRPPPQPDPVLGNHAGAMEPLCRGKRDWTPDDGAGRRAPHAARQARPHRHGHHQSRHDASRGLYPLWCQQGRGRSGDGDHVSRPRRDRGHRQCAGAGRNDRYADHRRRRGRRPQPAVAARDHGAAAVVAGFRRRRPSDWAALSGGALGYLAAARRSGGEMRRADRLEEHRDNADRAELWEWT